MQSFRLPAVGLGLCLSGLSVAQNAAPKAASSVTQIKSALTKVERVTPTTLDTLKFKTQIKETFEEHEQEPENPKWPEWMFKTHPKNGLPVGTANLSVQAHPTQNFPAIDATGWTPPDPNLAVGESHVVVVVNSSLAFFRRDGTKQFQQTFQDFYAGTGAGFFLFDPKCFYDRISKRFFVLALEQADSPRTSKVLVAVSDDSDPNGKWYRYRFDSHIQGPGMDAWLDYPGFGYNKDAMVATGNLFGFDGGFFGVLFMTVPKAPMLSGQTAIASYIRDDNAATAQMAQIWSPTEGRLFGLSRQDTATAKLYAISNPATTSPSLATTFVSFPNYDWPAFYAASTPGALDILDTRFFNANYRNGRLTTAHSVRLGTDQNQVRWYEFNLNNWPTSGAPTLRQSGQVAPTDPTQHFHMPAIGQNAAGEITTIFTRSSNSIPADLMIASRRQSDPLGSMGFPQLLKTSDASGYGGAGVNRWGDYFDVNVDPVDDSTFWGVGMVAGPGGNWRTHVFSWTVKVAVPIDTMSLAPYEVLAGTDPINMTLTLLNAAPKEGVAVTVTANDPAVFSPTVPFFKQGDWRSTFALSSTPVTDAKVVTVTASTPGTPSKTAQVLLRPRRVEVTAKLMGIATTHAGRTVTLTLRTPNTTIALERANLFLNAKAYAGYFTDRTGLVDGVLEAPGFLRKVMRLTLPNSGPVQFAVGLVNGDVNRDNAVDAADVAIVKANLNKKGTNADVDGDGRVTPTDLAIVQANVGKRGDN